MNGVFRLLALLFLARMLLVAMENSEFVAGGGAQKI